MGRQSFAVAVREPSNEFPGNISSSREIDQLLGRVLDDNDYSAFRQLFLTLYHPLCTFCARLVKVEEVAEELVSDVFYTIWKNRDRIEVTSARAYLFAAVRNRGFDHLRKARKSISCALDEASELACDYTNGQDRMVEHELTVAVEESIARLPAQCRLIFLLSREEGLKYREIATRLGLSVKTVETQMGRAFKHLRTSLQLSNKP
jgi:RNA polymerase sigma-70 factor (family 1)